MIGDVLVFLKNDLNAQLRSLSDPQSSKPEVDFVDGAELDPLKFRQDMVSVLLINVEEDNTLRADDPYLSTSPDGRRLRVSPPITMNLYVLFVARYSDYEASLRQLSRVIEHFQKNRAFDRASAPGLSERVERLQVELVTPPFAEQNEIWGALRTAYHPSVLYKVKIVSFTDLDGRAPALISETNLEISQ